MKLMELINETKTRQFRLSQTKNGTQIHQTDRNNYKKELMQALKQDLSDNYEYVYESADGILLEIANDIVADGVDSADASGAITIAIDIKVLGVEHNAETESNYYSEEMQAKAEKKAEKLASKKSKMERDKATRKKKEQSFFFYCGSLPQTTKPGKNVITIL